MNKILIMTRFSPKTVKSVHIALSNLRWAWALARTSTATDTTNNNSNNNRNNKKRVHNVNYVSRKLVLNRLTGSDFSYLVNGVVCMLCSVLHSAAETSGANEIEQQQRSIILLVLLLLLCIFQRWWSGYLVVCMLFNFDAVENNK